MARDDDQNYMSVGSWMLLLFLVSLPVIGLFLIVIFAFVGQNQTRKNYFRAIIVWFLLLIAVVIGLAALGFIPALAQVGHQWLQQNHK